MFWIFVYLIHDLILIFQSVKVLTALYIFMLQVNHYALVFFQKWHIFYQFVCLFRYESFIFNAIFMKREPGGEKKVICQAGELGQSSIW